MILDQDCLFQTTTAYWCECMEKIQLSIPEWKPAQKDTLGNRKKEKKTYTKVLPESSELCVNNDDIGICKIWRNDSKSPVWITEWKQRRSSTMKEIEDMSLVAVLGGRKGFYFKSPNLKKLLLLKKWNNRGNITQIQKETAYLPPSSSLLRESIVKILQEN